MENLMIAPEKTTVGSTAQGSAKGLCSRRQFLKFGIAGGGALLLAPLGCKSDPASANNQAKCDYARNAKACFLAGDWKNAATGFEQAMEASTTEADKACCATLAAQSWSCIGEYKRAATLADKAARWCPTSKEIAASRLAYWHAVAKDSGAEYATGLPSAKDHLMRLEPAARGEPVCEPVTGAIIIVGLVLGAYLISVYAVPKEQRAAVVSQAVQALPSITHDLASVLRPI